MKKAAEQCSAAFSCPGIQTQKKRVMLTLALRPVL